MNSCKTRNKHYIFAQKYFKNGLMAGGIKG